MVQKGISLTNVKARQALMLVQVLLKYRPRSSMFTRRLIAADQASVFMAMMSDHNSSDLAPQRQEMSVENVSSGLVPQGQKASDYDNSDPMPPRQNVVPTAEKTDSSQHGLEFLFSPLLEEYYNPAHGHAEDNNNDQAPNASFQEDEFINPFCTRVQEIGELIVRQTKSLGTRSTNHLARWLLKLKWLWKNKKDEDQTVIRNKARLVAKGYA
ncbi:hypothetical protein Tco_0330820 [Tanacetum coccineum]